jgi:hypothetical protein
MGVGASLVALAIVVLTWRHYQYAWWVPPQWVPPGALVAVMGALAAIMTFLDWPARRWEKAIAIFVFTTLAALEICVLKREQNIAQGNFNTSYRPLLQHRGQSVTLVGTRG